MTRTKAEIELANELYIKIDELGWYDNWTPDELKMTWRRNNKQSVLDRVFFNFIPSDIKTLVDWKLNLSDHAVVIVDLGMVMNNFEIKKLILNKTYYNT